ncbi:phenoloxidase-activating enzyme-like [Diabrotica virgifera virgifera]|uniref:Peptidase S1 domain-containing protein n=1 Tax=Diabrotica virgifera virgifera TaxID=50390 RepID=A0ABM5KPW0_DIAVI|nr:phenoloxidase-activating enzyme-like [Diabrotica virgifera virgifera]
MKGVNVLIGVLWFYLNIVNGNSQYWGPGAIANEVCRRYKDDSIINHISPDPLDTRITGEKLAKKGEFPHMVQLGYIKSNKTKYLCSGFIISKKYIITAANCVNGENTDQPQFVRAGVTDEHDVSNEQIRSIHNILALSYITLIRVEEDFNFNKFVSPVCIYTRDKDPDGPGIFTGWSPADIVDEKQRHMTKLTLNIDSNESCNNTLAPTEKYELSDILVKNKIVCAGGKTIIDGCQIDSGGLLQVYSEDDNMYYAVGVSSFGSRVCGKKELPIAFTKFYYYYKWIEDTVWPRVDIISRFLGVRQEDYIV